MAYQHSGPPSAGGDLHKGKIKMPLLRGAAMQPEVTVIAPLGQCDSQIDMTIKWNEQADWVKVRLRGDHVLERKPDIDRTPGVNFFPNPFWPEPEDIVDGRYQFWFISPGENIIFYYDYVTLDLLGSEYDFPTPPPAIAIPIPGVNVMGSQFFQPDANGDLDVTLTWNYSAMTRGDRPEFAHHRVSFPPTNLCENNRYRYDLSTTRGVISDPLPAAEALPFSEYLRNGSIFNITIEPADYFVEPPLDTQTSAYSNASTFGGGIPAGHTLDIDAFFMNVAPGIRPWEGAAVCGDFFTGVHTKNLNFCGSGH